MRTRSILLLLSIVLFACNDDKNDDGTDVYPNNSVVITSGVICGWCSDADSLVITDDAYQYVTFNVCNSDKHLADKSGVPDADDWEALMQLFDYPDFRSVEVNSSDISFDGCDHWVQVRYYGKTHRIRYGSSESDQTKIEPIRPFLFKLEEIKASIKSAD